MQDLKVIGVENGALLAASDDGERYRIAIDEVLQSTLKQNKPDSTEEPKLSPREVQAHIRAGMSAEDVAAVTGASLEYIRRFEGPIIAEREHIVASALSVPVHTTVEVDPLGEPATFGTAIRDRLAGLGASGERWASWKEHEGGWIVKLSFTAEEIDHDARWSYEPRKNALAPLNSEATTLSQQGELHGGLIPRLRAVATGPAVADESRFDSAAFTFTAPSGEEPDRPTAHPEAFTFGRSIPRANNSIAVTAINRSHDDSPADMHQTADLLESLRRRRGEREAANYDPDPDARANQGRADLNPQLVDVPLDDFEGLSSSRATGGTGDLPGTTRGGKRGRASMPSWDEIVFGARTDDDLA
ncbi:MAG: septation protein SepH [Microbacteriaceae bacterium]